MPSWSFAALAYVGALATGTIHAQTQLETEQQLYPPGSVAVLMGEGYASGEVVTMHVLPNDGTPVSGPEHDPWTVTADAEGRFTTTWMVSGESDGLVLEASAAGSSSGSSTTEFRANQCGTGVVTSVAPAGSECVDFTPAQGNGPDNWEVQEGGTYIMTLEGVTECEGDTITVFVQGGVTGNFCFNATGGSGTYSGMFTMPSPACFTYPINYKCGADADCTPGDTWGAQGPATGCGGVHLRSSVFGAGCTVIGQDDDCTGGCVPCMLTCPPDLAIDCGDSTAPASTGMPTGCAAPTFSDATTAGACAGEYVITRTWTADDGCGGTATCVQTITVTDSTGPVIDCPMDVSLDCSDPTDPANTGMATATDDCSGAAVTFDDSTTTGACAGNYVISRTWTATDGCGNTSTCVQTITVSDTTGPVIDCPMDVSLDCSDPTDPANTGMATAMDDCSGVASIDFSDSTTPGDCAGNFVITRTWTATDDCGNSSTCEQTISVTDTTGPVIDCPMDVSLDCSDSTDPSNTGMATAMDDCSGVASIDFSDSTTPGDCAGNFVIIRTWTATDDCGNSSTCTQTISVTDTTGPVIDCPPGVSLDCSDSTDPSNTGTATASDDCSGPATLSYDDVITPGACDGEFTIARTWTAIDGCGNSSTCKQTITVTDTTPPEVVCPPDATFVGCCLLPDIGVPTVTEDCGTVTISNDAPMEFCLGETIVTWTVMDDCGNTTTCQQVVTVVPVCIDFETDPDGNPLLHGQSLETPGPEATFSCPSITSGIDPVSPGNGNNGLAVFDSTNGPFGQDPDLNVGLGNLLYLQANGGPTDSFSAGSDTWDNPNDDEDGGTVTFSFCMGVQMLSVDLVDIDQIDANQDVDVTLVDGGGLTRVYNVPGGWTADGPGAAAVRTLDLGATGTQTGFLADATETTQPGFDPMNVIAIEFRFGSSGALDNLKYCPTSPTAAATTRNGTGLNPNVLAPASMPVLGASWAASLDCSDFGPGVAVMTMRLASSSEGISPYGEVLIGGPLLHQSSRAHLGGPTRMTWDIPYDMTLCGMEIHVQGMCQSSSLTVTAGKEALLRSRLTNAIDLVIGF